MKSNDLLLVKLRIDKIVDPMTDEGVMMDSIKELVDEVRKFAPLGSTSDKTLSALRKVLYESGPWNENRPFRYDQSDPTGENPDGRLLRHYLETRRGNCITMPLLMFFIGRDLGLEMQLAEAPLHLYIKYYDGKYHHNIEATSGGGFTRDFWYRKNLPMTDLAIYNGVYLRSLSDTEAKAVISSFIVENYLRRHEFEKAAVASEVVLGLYPRFAYGLVKKGSAYGGLLQRELKAHYGHASEFPEDLKEKASRWYRENISAFSQAEELGWRPQDGQARD